MTSQIESENKDDGFHPVVRKKKRNQKNKFKIKEKTVDDHLQSLNEKQKLVENSDFYTHFITKLDDEKKYIYKRVRCLALGAPTDWLCEYAAMYQLALLQLIAKKFDINDISIYDPVFETADNELFEKLNIKVEQDYPDDKYNDCDTLLYMPHAPLDLIDTILTKLSSNTTIIGNDLSSYTTKRTQTELETKYPNVLDAINKIVSNNYTSISIPNKLSDKQPYSVAFNELAITINTTIENKTIK